MFSECELAAVSGGTFGFAFVNLSSGHGIDYKESLSKAVTKTSETTFMLFEDYSVQYMNTSILIVPISDQC